VYALHAARRIKINLMTEAQWAAIEEKLRQPDLVAASARRAGRAKHPSRRLYPRTPAPANKSNNAGPAVRGRVPRQTIRSSRS
jgi:hypothetical protein